MSWEGFRRQLASYFAMDAARRRQIIFRGHSDSRWALTTTLDRYKSFTSDAERERGFADLLGRFRREALHVDDSERAMLQGDALELMARHHGLPTPLLDWTESPYIAAFFAFENAAAEAAHVAVWMLDRAKLPDSSDEVTIIDEVELLARNRRAIQQRGVFLRVRTVERRAEEILSPALVKFEIDRQWADEALVQLDSMTINATRLFGDLDAAARTVRWRESRGGTSGK
jgi:hypothetical protein